MLKRFLFVSLAFFISSRLAWSQDTKYAIDALPVGGKEQLEQVLETQLTLPKTLLTSHFEADLNIYFELDNEGRAANIKVEGASNNMLRQEVKRILGLLNFSKAQNVYKDPYTLNLKLSTVKYNRYFKQKNKLTFKKPLPADSSNVIYTKADKAPEYYKNGEPGLEELILTQMEYPRLAIEKSIEGTVVIEFVVETNGYITSLNVRQGIGAGCTEEAIKVIKMTKWQPAVLNNKFVRYKMSYPITFSLRNITKDNASSAKTTGQ